MSEYFASEMTELDSGNFSRGEREKKKEGKREKSNIRRRHKTINQSKREWRKVTARKKKGRMIYVGGRAEDREKQKEYGEKKERWKMNKKKMMIMKRLDQRRSKKTRKNK